MQVSVTILSENTAPRFPLVGEYGFSALVKVDDNSILFDTGSADALYKNAAHLGIKLDEVNAVAISHGHYDHTGGLLSFFEKYGPRKVYAHPNIFAKRPKPISKSEIMQIGCRFSQEQLEAVGAEFIFCKEYAPIFPNVYISGEIPHLTEYEDVGGDFKIETTSGLIKDDLIDDMAVIIDHPQGLIIISGCAHAGIINIIEHAIKTTNKTSVQAVIGGTHLMTASQYRIDRTIEALNDYNVKRIILSHCTGFYAAAKLYTALGDKVIKGETGMQFIFN